MLLINKTYEVVTPESAEDGEISESGFDQEDAPYTFRELVSAMRCHYEPSCWPVGNSAPAHVWFTSGADIDFVDGSETRTSIHFSRSNPARKARYWIKAARAAGIVK